MQMDRFWHAFLPLFVALDGIGLLPVFMGLTHRLSTGQRRSAANQAVVTALLATTGFALLGAQIFELMGLAFADVMVAGGTILIVLCLRDLLFSDEPPRGEHPHPGVVPVGVPLLAGPAVLTTVLLVKDQVGWTLAMVSLLLNMALVWIILSASSWLMRWLGREGAQLMSKIFSLILTAFGVMLIRRGLLMFTTNGV
jgi:multiple antibiotic resistance protein